MQGGGANVATGEFALAEMFMKYIECHGNVRECGRQYGEQASQEIRLQIASALLPEPSSEVYLRFTALAEESLLRYAPEVYDELTGVSEGAGVAFSQLLFLNCVDTFDSANRCTPVIVRHSEHGQLISKNNDGPAFEQMRNPFIVRRVIPDQGLAFLQVTYAGWLSGLDMLNSSGLANTHGSVGSIYERPGIRLDIRLRFYQLMRKCRTVEEVLAEVLSIPLTGKGFAIALGDCSGDNAMLDAAVPCVHLRSRRKTFEFATNLYETPGLENADTRTPEGKIIGQQRREFLRKIADNSPPQSLPELLGILRLHGDGAPCRHGEGEKSRTFWSMVALSNEKRLLLCDGFPCQHDYKNFAF